MTQKRPSLGRGLEALLGQISASRVPAPGTAAVPGAKPGAPGGAAQPPAAGTPGVAAANAAGAAAPAANAVAGASRTGAVAGTPAPALPGLPGDELRRLPLDLLQRGRYQPRSDMRPESLEELAASIRSQGIVQPIVVRPVGPPGADAASQRYEIIAGERRWRAAQMAGLADIPAVIRHVPDDAAIAMALIENIQREDLNPLEEARALDRLIREFGVTHQQAADAVGRSRAAVSNLLRLLDLAPEVAELVETRAIEMGHARALLGLPTRRQQVETATLVAKKGLSVRQTEALVRQLNNPPKSPPARPPADPNVQQLQSRLSDTLGAQVVIDHSPRSGKGKVVVTYNSLDELDGILSHIS